MPLLTLQQHILEEQRRHHPQATGDFSWLLSGITLAAKMIESRVRRAGLTDLLGAAGHDNVQGEVVQKLDVFANQALIHCLGNRGNVAVMASEEDEQPIVVPRDREHGRYVVVYDPLDGSSNIDVNVSVGTIFAIFRRSPDPTRQRDPLTDVLQPGTQQVAAGYVVYGSSTMLVYTAGNGVHGFTLDPSIGAFIISHENIKMPQQGGLYSVNEANADTFPEAYRHYLAHLSSRRRRPAVFLALHRLPRRGFPPHASKGRHFSLSPNAPAPPRQAPPHVRSQPDRLPGRASRRVRNRWRTPHPGNQTNGPAPTHAVARGEHRGDGIVEADVELRRSTSQPSCAECRRLLYTESAATLRAVDALTTGLCLLSTSVIAPMCFSTRPGGTNGRAADAGSQFEVSKIATRQRFAQ